MPLTLFFSYSHVDEALRNQLEVHLAALKRQGLIATWHDRRITAGTPVGDAIDANLNSSNEREMARAMERHKNGDARVIPIILRPCDWHDLPFGKLLAAPRDGKAITTWPNIDEAFLDVERAIKAAVKELGERQESAKLNPTSKTSGSTAPPKSSWPSAISETLGGPRSSNLRVKKEFTDLDRDRFRHEGFEFIARFLKTRCKNCPLASLRTYTAPLEIRLHFGL